MGGIFGNQGVWSCGFDFVISAGALTSGLTDQVLNATVGPAYARGGVGNGVQLVSGNPVNYLGRSLGVSLAQAVTGFGWNPTALPSGGQIWALCSFYSTDNGGIQFSVGVNSSGQLGIYTGGLPNGAPTTLISSLSPIVIVANAYPFIEVSGVIGSSGSVTVQVNGVVALTFNGNTLNAGGPATVGRIYIGMGASTANPAVYVDDWYILDTTAPSPLNTFLGPGRARVDGPSGESATVGLNQWTPTNPVGTDFGNCANIPANSAQYNSSSVIGQRMSLSYPSLSNVGRALFVNAWINLEEDTSGTRGVTPIFRNGGTDQSGSAIVLSTAFTYYNQASIIDPSTGVLWAIEPPSAIAACEIGLEVTS